MKLQVLFIFLFLFIVGCTSSIKNQGGMCSKERTNLDDVCVKDEIADYVSCVRAQGTRLGKEQSQSLSAEIGSFAANAVAARDVSEKLDKKYTASNEAVMAIIRQCNILAGIVFETPSLTVSKSNLTNHNDQVEVYKKTNVNCSLRSTHYEQKSTVSLHNLSNHTVAVYWLDYEGIEQYYFSLTPNKSQDFLTFISHPWCIRDANSGQPINSIIVTQEAQTIIIK